MSLRLRCGTHIPPVAFGTGTDFMHRDPEVLIEAMCQAWDIGYRFFDTAMIYGNEDVVGIGLKRIIDEKGARRQDFFVQAKLYGHCYQYQDALNHVQKSLEMLNLDYVDSLLHHFPGPQMNKMYIKQFLSEEEFRKLPETPEDLQFGRFEVWRALQDLKGQGKARHIGVSNYNSDHLKQILKNPGCVERPELNQIEAHVHYFDKDLIRYCQQNGVLVQAFSPLGTGRNDYYIGRKEDGFVYVLDDPVIQEISSRTGLTAAQVCIKYLNSKNLGVVIKSENKDRLRENIEAPDKDLSQVDCSLIDNIKRRRRIFTDIYSSP